MKLKRFSLGGPRYTFATTSSDISYNTIPELVANLIYSVAFIHFYHLCETDYDRHVILNEYYDEMGDKADAIAEHWMSKDAAGEYKPSIIPADGECPLCYLQKLERYINNLEGDFDSATQSDIDDANGLIRSTIYKLVQLTNVGVV